MSGGNGELPEGWAIASLEELCDLNPKHDRGISDDTPVSFVPMAAVSDTEGRITEPEVRTFGEVRKGYTHFADGDVIFAKITPCMENGKAASVRGLTNGLACGTTEFYVFRSRGAIDQDFLHRFVRQESYRKAARAQMQSGVGQARVPKEFVRDTQIPIAPLPEQHRIVAKIEALQERSSRARAALAEVGPLLEQFRQSVLAAAFRGDLTADWRRQHPDVEPATELLQRTRTERRQRWEESELAKYEAKGKKPPKNWREKYKEPESVAESDLPGIPRNWCWATLDEISAKVQDGNYGGDYPKKNEWTASGVPFLTPAAVDFAGEIIAERVKYVSEEKNNTLRKAQLEVGDVIFPNRGSREAQRVGKQAFAIPVPDEWAHGNINPQLTLVRPLSPLNPDYVASAMNSDAFLTQVRRETGGSALAFFNLATTKRMHIPMAPLAEQTLICEKVESAVLGILRTFEVVGNTFSDLNQLDQSILAKAFRGELVPQDPSDEPAAQLLARIRQQREAAGKDKMQKRRGKTQRGN